MPLKDSCKTLPPRTAWVARSANSAETRRLSARKAGRYAAGGSPLYRILSLAALQCTAVTVRPRRRAIFSSGQSPYLASNMSNSLGLQQRADLRQVQPNRPPLRWIAIPPKRPDRPAFRPSAKAWLATAAGLWPGSLSATTRAATLPYSCPTSCSSCGDQVRPPTSVIHSRAPSQSLRSRATRLGPSRPSAKIVRCPSDNSFGAGRCAGRRPKWRHGVPCHQRDQTARPRAPAEDAPMHVGAGAWTPDRVAVR
jgi:hypothetical protein